MLEVTGWQCVLVYDLLRQVDGGGDAPDHMVDVACRGREGSSRQRLHHTLTV